MHDCGAITTGELANVPYDLRPLVEGCLKFRVTDRWTAKDVLKWLNEFTEVRSCEILLVFHMVVLLLEIRVQS